ncbi:hypothetical protein SAMN04487786_0800 [Paenisporosarcina quisquiliarum]|nr:hypothetical protein SAMN04487786_0800 [Paenisporosarcina quisquiliarum]
MSLNYKMYHHKMVGYDFRHDQPFFIAYLTSTFEDSCTKIQGNTSFKIMLFA